MKTAHELYIYEAQSTQWSARIHTGGRKASVQLSWTPV